MKILKKHNTSTFDSASRGVSKWACTVHSSLVNFYKFSSQLIFTARSVAERGIAKASCPSICDVEVPWSYTGWNSAKIISVTAD